MARPKTKFNQGECLKVWSKIIKKQNGRHCAVCKKAEGKLDSHHIISKRFCSFEFLNGIILCPFHHSFGLESAHRNAVWFAEWLREHRPEQYKFIMKFKYHKKIWTPAKYKIKYYELNSYLEKMKNGK